MVEGQGDAEEAKKTGEMEASNAEKTPPEVEAMDKIKSSGETFGIVRIQKRLEPSSETADYLVIPKEEGSVDGHNYSITVGGKAILNAVGPDAGAEVGYVGAADITENVCSCGEAMDDSMKKSQVEVTELSTSGTAHEIITVDSKSDIDEKMQNEDVLEGKDNVENMKQNADTTSSSPSDQTKMARSTNVVVEGRTKDTISEDISTIKSTEDANGTDQSEATAEDPRSGGNNTLPGTYDKENKEQDAHTTKGPASNGNEGAQNIDVEGRTEETTSEEISTIKSTEDANGDQSEATTEDPRSGEDNTLPCTDKENKEQNANTIKGPASDENNNAAQKTDVEGRMEGTASGVKGVDRNEEITASGRIPSSLRDLFSSENMQTEVLGYDQKTHTTEDIIERTDKTKGNSEDEESTKNRSNENIRAAKEKKARIKTWSRLFSSRSSKDNVSVSSKDNGSRSSKDTSPVKECSCGGSMWRFCSKRRRQIG